MSRIIIRNLPNGTKEQEIRDLFGAQGHITDCSLKYTKDGVFRKFGFIGYQSEEQAKAAIKHFDKSFIRTARIKVEIASDIGDTSKPRAWSKYAADSSAFKKQNPTEKKTTKDNKIGGKSGATDKKKDEKTKKEEKKKGQDDKKKQLLDELLGDVKDDPGFQEFLQVHTARTNKTTWGNELFVDPGADRGQKVSDSDSSDIEEEDQSKRKEVVRKDESDTSEEVVKVKDSGQSDMDFLKSKMSDKQVVFSDSDSDTSDEETQSPQKDKKKPKSNSKKASKKKADSSSDSDSSSSDDETEVTNKKKQRNVKENKKNQGNTEAKKKNKGNTKESKKLGNVEESKKNEGSSEEEEEETKENEGNTVEQEEKEETEEGSSEVIHYIIKMKGVPATVKENQIREFFKPIEPSSIKIPKNAKGKAFCLATAEFSSEDDHEAAMRRNKNFIGPKRVFLYKIRVVEPKEKAKTGMRPWEVKLASENSEEVEGIAETGRLYVRNLAFVCTEEDLEKLFSPYGPLAEVHLPIDTFTKKIKCFAFILFMMPEHAVKAYQELDGKVFQESERLVKMMSLFYC